MPILGIDENAEALADALINPEPWWRQQVEMVGESLFGNTTESLWIWLGSGPDGPGVHSSVVVLRWVRYRDASGQRR